MERRFKSPPPLGTFQRRGGLRREEVRLSYEAHWPEIPACICIGPKSAPIDRGWSFSWASEGGCFSFWNLHTFTSSPSQGRMRFVELENARRASVQVKLRVQNSFVLMQDPLEAIVVIFGRSSLFFWKLLEKYEKWHHLCANAQWWSPLETQKCQKIGTSLRRI